MNLLHRLRERQKAVTGREGKDGGMGNGTLLWTNFSRRTSVKRLKKGGNCSGG